MYKTTIKKELFKEIRRVGKKYRIQWDCQPIMIPEYDSGGTKTGEHEDPYFYSCMEHLFDHKPELVEIKSVILGYYNEKTNNEIILGLSYSPESGVTLHPYLSNENQMNYKNAYDTLKDASTIQYVLPYTIKNSDGYEPRYYSFTSSLSFRNFYLAIMSHINTKLNEAWELKDSIDWEKYILEEEAVLITGTVPEETSIYGEDYTGVVSEEMEPPMGEEEAELPVNEDVN